MAALRARLLFKCVKRPWFCGHQALHPLCAPWSAAQELTRSGCGRARRRYQAAEVRARQAQEALTQQEAEAVKLEQRLAAAREQYDSGLAKLRSTARQLESLASQARWPRCPCSSI